MLTPVETRAGRSVVLTAFISRAGFSPALGAFPSAVVTLISTPCETNLGEARRWDGWYGWRWYGRMGGGGMGGMGGGGMGGGGMGGGGMGGMGGGGMGGGGMGGGGGFTRMTTTDMIRQQMNVTDDNEWAVIQPKLQRVIDAQASLSTSTRAGRGGGGGGGMGGMGGAAGGMGGAMGGGAMGGGMGGAMGGWASRGHAAGDRTAPASIRCRRPSRNCKPR